MTDEQPTVTDDAVDAAPETPALPSYSGHPPRGHNPHVYQILDAGKPESVTVTQRDIPAEPVSDEQPVDEAPADESAPDTDVDGDGQVSGYEVFTKDDLVAECKERKLPTTGNKPDLVARLQEADKAASGGE